MAHNFKHIIRFVIGLLALSFFISCSANPDTLDDGPTIEAIVPNEASSAAVSPDTPDNDPALEAIVTSEASSAAAFIPFTTIAQAAALGDQPGKPQYVVVTGPEQWEKLSGLLHEEVIAAGVEAEQKRGDLIIVGYAGLKNSSGYALSIDLISQEGTELKVILSESEPGGEAIVEPATSLPYHIVLLPEGSFQASNQITVTFLDSQGTVLSQQSITRP